MLQFIPCARVFPGAKKGGGVLPSAQKGPQTQNYWYPLSTDRYNCLVHNCTICYFWCKGALWSSMSSSKNGASYLWSMDVLWCTMTWCKDNLWCKDEVVLKSQAWALSIRQTCWQPTSNHTSVNDTIAIANTIIIITCRQPKKDTILRNWQIKVISSLSLLHQRPST